MKKITISLLLFLLPYNLYAFLQLPDDFAIGKVHSIDFIQDARPQDVGTTKITLESYVWYKDLLKNKTSKVENYMLEGTLDSYKGKQEIGKGDIVLFAPSRNKTVFNANNITKIYCENDRIQFAENVFYKMPKHLKESIRSNIEKNITCDNIDTFFETSISKEIRKKYLYFFIFCILIFLILLSVVKKTGKTQ